MKNGLVFIHFGMEMFLGSGNPGHATALLVDPLKDTFTSFSIIIVRNIEKAHFSAGVSIVSPLASLCCFCDLFTFMSVFGCGSEATEILQNRII